MLHARKITRALWRRGFMLAALLCLWVAAQPAAAAISPESLRYRGYVNDFAEVIDDQWEKRIGQLAANLDQKTKAQIALVTLSSLEGEPIEDFANRLFQVWGIGHRDDRGVLLLLVIKDRKSRLEVGYGLEPIIPDGYAGNVLREMRPALRDANYSEAAYAGVALLANRIAAQAGVKLDEPALASQRRPSSQSPDWLVIALVLAATVLFGIMPLWLPGLGVGYRRRRWWGGGAIIFGGGFGGYDTSGSGGGFGGFGGGSSGGGGASSNW